MANITYLLGAGASINALPITNEIPRHLGLMADYIEQHFPSEPAFKYVADIRELRNQLSDFNTIDNYARMLSQHKGVHNSRELKKLKSILSGLFLFEQLRKKNEIINKFSNISSDETDRIKRTVDLRYKSFFAKVLNNDKLSDEINIISWNYDIQLEIGLESNLGLNYDELENSCKIYPHPSCKISDESNFFSRFNWSDSPKIVKLNGTAGLFIKDNSFHNIYLSQEEFFDDRLDVLLEVHKEIERYRQYSPFLKFAWEKDEQSTLAIDHASSIIDRTHILVVIGYSFPDFNRPIDKQVFTQNHIEEVFVQLPADDFEGVQYNMRSSLGRLADKAVHIKQLREFFIPKEFIPRYWE